MGEQRLHVLDIDPQSPAFGSVVQILDLPWFPTEIVLSADKRTAYVISYLADFISTLALPLPPVSVFASAHAFYVPSGDTLLYDVEVTNNSLDPQTVAIWIDVVDVLKPDGTVFHGNPIAGPKTVELPAGGGKSALASLRVPPRILPSGPYTIRAGVGGFPDLPMDESTFQFYVVE